MKIEIKSAAVSVRSGTGENGRPWKMQEQQGYAYTVGKDGTPDAYPQKVTVRLQEGQVAYPPGEYVLEDRSFFIGQYGRLTLGDLVLSPAPKVAALAKAG